jgi:hypothetical protein
MIQIKVIMPCIFVSDHTLYIFYYHKMLQDCGEKLSLWAKKKPLLLWFCHKIADLKFMATADYSSALPPPPTASLTAARSWIGTPTAVSANCLYLHPAVSNFSPCG